MASQEKNLAAVLLSPKTDFVVQARPIPIPGPGELVVRVHAIGLNPIDWKRQSWDFFISSYPAILGTDLAGTIHSTSPNTVFSPSTRVLSFAHGISSQSPANAAFQTYVLVRANATAPLPASLSFTQGATLPTAISTALMALVDILGLSLPPLSPGLPNPNTSAAKASVLLVWGGASSGVGTLAVQLAILCGFTVFTTASAKHHERLREMGAAVVVDYRDANVVDTLVGAARERGKRVGYVVDAISSAETLGNIVRVLDSPGNGEGERVRKVAHTLPWPGEVERPGGIEAKQVHGDDLWVRREDLCGWLYGEALPKWLGEGKLVLSPERVVGKGVGAIQGGLEELKRGVSGEKLVVEI